MACLLLSSNGCSSPLGPAGGLRVSGGARAATAAPWPSSAALQTGHAWPVAGELQTSGASGPASPVDTLLQTVGVVACRGREGGRLVAGWERGLWGTGIGPGGVPLPWDPEGAEKNLD